MSKLLIVTQVYENYAWREDGTIGTGAEAYWKAKGGSEYVIRNIDVNRVAALVESATAQVEQANDYYTETVIGWEVVADDYMTEFERDQLEYEGKIEYPAKELEVA
jgi:hypothetical protein